MLIVFMQTLLRSDLPEALECALRGDERSVQTYTQLEVLEFHIAPSFEHTCAYMYSK